MTDHKDDRSDYDRLFDITDMGESMFDTLAWVARKAEAEGMKLESRTNADGQLEFRVIPKEDGDE